MPIQQESVLKSQLRSALCDQVIGIRDRRRLVEQKWLQSRRAWMGVHLNAHVTTTDTSPANYSIPAARRVAERTIVRVVKLLTPSVKWFEVSPSAGSNVPLEKVSNVDSYMSYVMKKKIKSRSNISQLARCMVLYGMPILKTSIAVKNGEVWPTQRAVDPFAFYMFPETAPTVDEAEVIFEDFLFSYERYRTLSAKGIVDPIERADLTAPEWPYHLTERLAYQGITDPTANVDIAIEKVSGQLQRTTAGFVSITELWITREDSLYQVYIAWNLSKGPRIVGFFKSQYNEPLYRLAIHRALPGETYTTTQHEDINELETVQNDLFNMFMEGVDWEQGFVAFGGSSGMRRDSLKMKGRAKWDLGSELPRDVLQFIQPPVTSTNSLRAWQIASAMMQSMGGAGTIAEGQPGRNMPRSGQATSQLINLGMADVQDLAEIIEQEVLTPGLSDIYKVSSFIPDSQLMRIPGGTAFYHGGTIQNNVLSKHDILGDYEFEWVGSLQFQDEAQNAQRMMIFLNLIPTLGPILEKMGYWFNLPELLQMIWRYSLGQRGLSKVIVPISTQQGQPGMQQPGAPGIPSPNGSPPPNSQQPPQVAGLKYNIPSPTAGFVQQG
jgi:hypothetical protein